MQACLGKPHIWVVNKADLPPAWDRRELESLNGRSPAVQVSAKTGAGLEELVQTVKAFSISGQPHFGDARWTLNARHEAALKRAKKALTQAIEAAQKDAYEECVALELQTTLVALGEIIGESATEDLLDQIFSKFCVGK